MSNQEQTVPAINIRGLSGLNRAMHELESAIYEYFESGKLSNVEGEVLLRNLNQCRVMQQYFIKTADNDGMVILDAQNESYLGEGLLSLHLVRFLVMELQK